MTIKGKRKSIEISAICRLRDKNCPNHPYMGTLEIIGDGMNLISTVARQGITLWPQT